MPKVEEQQESPEEAPMLSLCEVQGLVQLICWTLLGVVFIKVSRKELESTLR